MARYKWNNPFFSLRAPEWVAAFYLFLLHFVWEMMQTPFFADMPGMAHWPATLFCLQATAGDVAIGVGAFAAASVVQRERGWFLEPSRPALAVYIAAGVVATLVLEWHALATGRWAYAGSMPVIPWFGIGAVPLLQWLVLPWIVLFLLRRHHLGAGRAIG